MDFIVETNVPMHVQGRGRQPSPLKFPFMRMEIGDSFLIEADISDKKTLDSWRRKVLAAKKRVPDMKFMTAIVGDGLRVWRKA